MHLCYADWYGMTSEDRVQKFIDDVKAEYEKAPFEALLLLGDYSLDHWSYHIKGSYLAKGALMVHPQLHTSILSQGDGVTLSVKTVSDKERFL